MPGFNKLVNVAFPKNKRIKTGRPNVITKSGAPSGSAPKGTFYLDSSSGNSYVYNGSSWVQIG